jgi:ribosomal protein L29
MKVLNRDGTPLAARERAIAVFLGKKLPKKSVKSAKEKLNALKKQLVSFVDVLEYYEEYMRKYFDLNTSYDAIQAELDIRNLENTHLKQTVVELKEKIGLAPNSYTNTDLLKQINTLTEQLTALRKINKDLIHLTTQTKE